MTLKRILWTSFVKISNALYVRMKVRHIHTIPTADLFIITVAFNNEFIIEQQILLLKKYLNDNDFQHIIIDNSTDKSKRKLIKSICLKENIAYYGLPHNWFSGKKNGPSYSHALSLNWTYKNIIVKYRPKYFGFIDHDLFLTAPYSIVEKIKEQDFYGFCKDRKQAWYLWTGFCFYNFEKTSGNKFNFLPCRINENDADTYLDSGGSNYASMYIHYDRKNLSFPPQSFQKIGEGNCYQTDFIQIIDDVWLHAICGSDYLNLGNKDNFLKDFLSKY